MNARLDLQGPPAGPLTPWLPKRHLLGAESHQAKMHPIFPFIEATLGADWLVTCFGQEKATEGPWASSSLAITGALRVSCVLSRLVPFEQA